MRDAILEHTGYDINGRSEEELHIYLHTREFRIMGAVHTFVAEIFGELIHTLETTDDQTFQVM